MQKTVNKLSLQVDKHQKQLAKLPAHVEIQESTAASDLSSAGKEVSKWFNLSSSYICNSNNFNAKNLNYVGKWLVCGRHVNRLKLATALVQPTPVAMALKLMACLFTKAELVNGNPSGITNSKVEQRQKTIKKLDPTILHYIEGNVMHWLAKIKWHVVVQWYQYRVPVHQEGIISMTESDK